VNNELRTRHWIYKRRKSRGVVIVIFGIHVHVTYDV